MTLLQPPLVAPNDCNFDTLQDIEREIAKHDGSLCYDLAVKVKKAIDQGVVTVTQDGRLTVHSDAVPVPLDEHQVFHAWQGMMRTMAHYVPAQLTKATKYRALFDDAVTYKRGTLKG